MPWPLCHGFSRLPRICKAKSLLSGRARPGIQFLQLPRHESIHKHWIICRCSACLPEFSCGPHFWSLALTCDFSCYMISQASQKHRLEIRVGKRKQCALTSVGNVAGQSSPSAGTWREARRTQKDIVQMPASSPGRFLQATLRQTLPPR